MAEPATARGTSGSGTSPGTRICITVSSKARAMPMKKAMRENQLAADRAEQDGGEQARRRDRLDRLARRQDLAAVMAVRHLADDQHQRDRRNELDQSDQPEIERIAGQLIELPADRDREHLVADRGADPRAPEQHERPVAQDGVGFGCRSSRVGLASRSREAAKAGGAEGDRTPDLLIANEALSQLSYGP